MLVQKDTKLVFDGNAQDFYIGLDDGTDDLLIGLGSAVGTTPAIAIDENLDIVTSGVINTTVAHDGGDTSITINNSAAGGSTDETASILFQHNGATGGGIQSLRQDDYSTGTKEDAQLVFLISKNGANAERMRLNDDGKLMIFETANAKMSAGITINQLGNDDEILAFKSSDIAHGVTDTTETDTWGVFRKVDGATGGMEILGLSDTSQSGLRFFFN